MNKWREVWYVWDGESPEPRAEKVLSVLQHGARGAWDTDDAREHGFLGINWDSIAAYTLGEKRRRIECPKCDDGVVTIQHKCGFFRRVFCHHCKGSGKTWEYAE